MPKGQPNNASSKHRPYNPYPQDGRLGVSRTNGVQPVPGNGVLVVEPSECSNAYYDPPQALFGEGSFFPHSSPSGWMRYPSPTFPIFSVSKRTAPQPPPLAPMDNVALPLLPSQRPPGGRGDPTATNIWWTPSVYDGHAQLPPSLGTDSALTPSYNRFAWMQYPDPTIWNPSPPPLLPFQELPENIRQVGSSRGSLMVESSLYNLYPQLQALHPVQIPFRMDPLLTRPHQENQTSPLFPYNSTESATPSVQQTAFINVTPQISSQWPVKGPPYSPQHLSSPSNSSRVSFPRSSALVANVPGAGPSPWYHLSTPCSAPHSMLPVDNTNFQSYQSQSENHTTDFSTRGTVIPTPGIEDLRPPRSFPVLNHCEIPTSSKARGGTTSFLSGASGFRMRDIHYFEASRVTVNTGGPTTSDKSIDGWKLLLKNTAPNALYNSSARYDAPKCDEDTRVEVTSEIMEWIQDREGPQRLLCMTGAAGAGKSALQQTIAEICEKGDILAISFFFSVADPSRNTIKAFVPTIAYQLGRRNPDLKRRMKHAVEDEPLIFSQSLQAQMDALIVGPFKNLRDMETNVDFRTLPYAILIDGLDECKGEDRQAELLTAIRRCLLADDLPFRIFVASRPEWAIRTALLSGGHLHTLAYHIQLSDRYDATEDMRRYLRRRFLDIGLRIGNFRWFTEEDIHLLAERASGQFVYVATAFKYISERRACPVHRLKTVLDWTPRDGQGARPFEALDVLYTSILSAAKEASEGIDTHSGHDFIFLVRILQMDTIDEISPLGKNLPAVLSSLLGMESNAVGLLISDLRSIFSFDLKDMDCLRLYHKSFSDFLGEESRAKDLYVPAERLDFNDRLPDKWEDLPIYETRRDTLLQAIMDLGFLLECDIDDDVVEFTRKGGWQQIHKLLPLILHPKADSQFWSDWFWLLGLYIDERDWQCQNPEVAEVMTKFHEKWERDIIEQCGRQGFLSS